MSYNRRGSLDWQYEIIKKKWEIAKRIYKELGISNKEIFNGTMNQIVFCTQMSKFLTEEDIKRMLLCSNVYQLDRVARAIKYS